MPRRGGVDEIHYRLAGDLDGNKATGFIRIELLRNGPNNDCDSGKQDFKVKKPAPKPPLPDHGVSARRSGGPRTRGRG